jgi:formate dehydrogenase maturation protein FdhE
MTTSTMERQDVGGAEQTPTWICDNCRTETSAVRKRCTDCGTSRY